MVTAPRVDAGNEPLAVPMRRWWTRLSSAHILIFSAGALAFIANWAILRPAELPPRVAVAVVDLLPGTIFDSARHAEFVPMDTDGEVLLALVPERSVAELDGLLIRHRVDAGSLIPRGVIVTEEATAGDRLMSIPIDQHRAIGGALAVGDVIDVIAVVSGLARYVVTGIEVVGLPAERSGSFASSVTYHVLVAVDADAALALSSAMDIASLHIVRSTGAPVPTALEYDPSDRR